jgi:hypothetical protein
MLESGDLHSVKLKRDEVSCCTISPPKSLKFLSVPGPFGGTGVVVSPTSTVFEGGLQSVE